MTKTTTFDPNTATRHELVKYLWDVHQHVASFSDSIEELRELAAIGINIERL